MTRTRASYLAGLPTRYMKDFVFLLVGTLVYQGTNLLINLGLAAYLGVEQFGTLQLVLTGLSYLSYTQLGILNSLNRDYNYFVGKRDITKAEDLRSYAFLGLFVVTLATVSLIWILYIAGVFPILTLMLVATGVFYFISFQLFNYVSVSLKVKKSFKSYGLGLILLSMLQASFCYLAYLHRGNLNAILMSFAGSWLLTSTIFLPYLRIRLVFGIKALLFFLREMIRNGFPIMVVGLSYYIFQTVDRWVGLRHLSIEDVGHYTFALKLVSAIPLVATLVVDQSYPYLNELFGRFATANALRGYVVSISLVIATLSSLVGLGVFIVSSYLIPLYFPRYVASLDTLPILLLAYLSIAAASLQGAILNILRKNALYFTIQMIFVSLFVLCGFILRIHSIVSLSWLTLVFFASYSVSLFALGWFSMKRDRVDLVSRN